MIKFPNIPGFTPPSFTPPNVNDLKALIPGGGDIRGLVTRELQSRASGFVDSAVKSALTGFSPPNIGGLVGGLLPRGVGGLLGRGIGGLGGRGGRNRIYQRMDPLFTFDFSAELPGLDDIYVEDVTLPIDKIESTSNFVAGTTVNYAGNYSIGPITMKFYEDRKHLVLRYLWTWRKSIHDDQGNFNPALAYKRRMIVKTKDAKGMPIATFIFTGCFPTDIDSIPLSSSSNDRIVMGATFSTDGLEIKFS